MNIRITIDRFEEDEAVLKTDDGQFIAWPKNKLPDSIKEGGKISITLDEGENGQEERAKSILNEILNNKNN